MKRKYSTFRRSKRICRITKSKNLQKFLKYEGIMHEALKDTVLKLMTTLNVSSIVDREIQMLVKSG
jgi:hypothetical protein